MLSSTIRTDPGKRFEYLLALHLLKLCRLLQDREEFGAERHYLRDRAGRKVDFLVAGDGQRDFVQDRLRCLPARQFFGALV